jgi:hypothetical protein
VQYMYSFPHFNWPRSQKGQRMYMYKWCPLATIFTTTKNNTNITKILLHTSQNGQKNQPGHNQGVPTLLPVSTYSHIDLPCIADYRINH